jgi:hypothetical protein
MIARQADATIVESTSFLENIGNGSDGMPAKKKKKVTKHKMKIDMNLCRSIVKEAFFRSE